MKIFSIASYLSSRGREIQSHLYHTLPYRSPLRKRIVTEPLYSRISPLGAPNLSVVPVLDQWIEEGNSIDKLELQRIINELSNYKRFKHALQVSLWMTNKRNFPLAPFDVATRLKLICRGFGMDQVEDYFDMIPEYLKTYHVYLALLNCYTTTGSVDKAESLMKKVRDFGYACKPIWYNLMMGLYCRTGNRERVKDLLMEMQAKGIPYDPFTLSMRIKACTDAKEIDKTMMLMDWDLLLVGQWQTPIIAAEGYLRVGSTDKALAILEKLEAKLMVTKRKHTLLVLLFRLYADARSKDRLYRVWNLYWQSFKPVTKVYKGMMHALMKFGDVEGMEKIFKEWESSGLPYDFRIGNVLIEAYCVQGNVEKAEAVINRGISIGGDPVVATWCHLARGYLINDQAPRATEALKRAISVCPPSFTSHRGRLISCLEHLKNRNRDCMEKLQELIESVTPVGRMKEDCGHGLVKDEELQSFRYHYYV